MFSDELLWLQVWQRIQYRLSLTVFQAVHGTAPGYITEVGSCTTMTASCKVNKQLSASINIQHRYVNRECFGECCSLVALWMYIRHSIVVLVKRLTTEPWKSNVAFCGMYHGLQTSKQLTRVTVVRYSIKMSDWLKILDVTLDASLTVEGHINEVVKSCNFHIRTLWHLRQSLTHGVTKTLTCSIVCSWLDYYSL